MPPPVAPSMPSIPTLVAVPQPGLGTRFGNALKRLRPHGGGGSKEAGPSAPVAETKPSAPAAPTVPDLSPTQHITIEHVSDLGDTDAHAGLEELAQANTGVAQMQQPGVREAAQAQPEISPSEQTLIQQLRGLGVEERFVNDIDFRRGYAEMVARGKEAVTKDKPTVDLNQLAFHAQQRYAFARENGIDIHTSLSPQYEQAYLTAVQQAEASAKPVWAGGEPVDRHAIAQATAQAFEANPPAMATRSIAEQLQSLGVDAARANDLQFQEIYARRFSKVEAESLQRKKNRGIIDARDVVWQANSEYKARVDDGTIKPADAVAQTAQQVTYEPGKQPGFAEFIKYPITGGIRGREAVPQVTKSAPKAEPQAAQQPKATIEPPQSPIVGALGQQSYGEWLKQRIADLPEKKPDQGQTMWGDLRQDLEGAAGTSSAGANEVEKPGKNGKVAAEITTEAAKDQTGQAEAAAKPAEAGNAPETPEQKIARLEAKVAALEQSRGSGVELAELFVKHPEALAALIKLLAADKTALEQQEKDALDQLIKFIASLVGYAFSTGVTNAAAGMNGRR